MDESNLPTPHNNFVQFLLANLSLARGLIERYLPVEVLADLDLTTLNRENGSFVDVRLREKHSDVLFSVQQTAQSGEALVYLLLEHKSEPDANTAFQLLSYLVRIGEQRIRERPFCC